MKTIHRAALAFACALALPAAAADDWLIRVRAARIDTANNSDPIPALGVPGDAIHVSDKTIPELDITYFFTKNWAAELVLTYPQKHDVSVEGLGKIGTFKHLPPTLTLQYHFIPDGDFRPYVGAGVNLTFISDVNLSIPGVGNLDLEDNSVGFAFGAGFDYKLSKNAYLNLDVKKIYLGSDVLLGGTTVSRVDIDPLLYSIGIGWRF